MRKSRILRAIALIVDIALVINSKRKKDKQDSDGSRNTCLNPSCSKYSAPTNKGEGSDPRHQYKGIKDKYKPNLDIDSVGFYYRRGF